MISICRSGDLRAHADKRVGRRGIGQQTLLDINNIARRLRFDVEPAVRREVGGGAWLRRRDLKRLQHKIDQLALVLTYADTPAGIITKDDHDLLSRSTILVTSAADSDEANHVKRASSKSPARKQTKRCR